MSSPSQGTVHFGVSTNLLGGLATNFSSLTFTGVSWHVGPFNGTTATNYSRVIWGSNLTIRTWDSSFSSWLSNPGNSWFWFGPFNPTPGAPPATSLASVVSSLAVVGSPMSVSAVWNETNAPLSLVEFWSVKQQAGNPSSAPASAVLVGTAPVLAISSTSGIDWTPTEPGVFYVYARATNSLGQLKESSWRPITVYAANDGFAHATPIPASAGEFQQTFNLRWSSVETNEPLPLTGLTGQSLWWRWTPDHSGLVSLRATQDGSDQALDVFTGARLTRLKRVAGTPGSVVGSGAPTLAWLRFKRGQTYFVRVSRYAPVISAIAGYSAFTLTQPDTTLTMRRYESKSLRANPPRMVEFSFFDVTRMVHGQLQPQVKARVRMPDGGYVVGSQFRAQLYVGSSLRTLQPVGPAQKFIVTGSGNTSQLAGTIMPTTVVLTGYGYGAWQPLVARVRVWDSTAGDTYETALNMGLTGESKALRIEPGTRRGSLDQLQGLTDFSLKLVQPVGTAAATLSFIGDQGQMRWRLTSPAGRRYAIEASSLDSGWDTILVLTNASGRVEFVDPRSPLPPASFYRARQLQ